MMKYTNVIKYADCNACSPEALIARKGQSTKRCATAVCTKLIFASKKEEMMSDATTL